MKLIRGFIILLCLVPLLLIGCGGDKDTLSDLYPGDRETVLCIDLMNSQGMCCMGTSDFLHKAWDTLDRIEYLPEVQTGDYDPDGDYRTVYFCTEEENIQLYFSRDYTQVIPVLDPESETYAYYTVVDSNNLQALFDTHIAIIYNEEITAQPFAAMDQPYQWMQGMTAEAMSEVRLGYSNSTNTSSGSHLSRAAFEELRTLLKAIPEDSLVNPETIGEGGSDQITTYYSDHPNLAISFQDEANDLGIVVRYYEKTEEAHLEILMIDDAYSVSPDNRGAKIQQAQKWDIQDEALLHWFREAAENPPSAYLRHGHWMPYDEERGILEVSDGETTLRVRSFEGWTYEFVEPGGESFGIRCRHPEQTEGWIYISFWPGGYHQPQHNRYVSSSDNGYYSYPLTVLYPNGTETEGQLWYEQVHYYENGDCVVLNEDADHWFADYAKDIDVQVSYSWEYAGERITKDPPEVTIHVDYTQCEDWSKDFQWFRFDTADPIGLNLTGWKECGWVYDDTPEGENTLLTYWPEYEAEGMVFIEYHEGLFQPPEDMTVEETTLHIDSYGGYPAKQGKMPGGERWSYCWIDRDNGSYVFRFENTEHWTDRKVEECLWALHTIQFRG